MKNYLTIKILNGAMLLVLALVIVVAPVVAFQTSGSILVRSIAWSPDGSKIAFGGGNPECKDSATDEHGIRIYDVATEQIEKILLGSTCQVYDVDWSPDGTKVVAASGDSYGIRVWNVATEQLLVATPNRGQGKIAVRWHPDGTKLAEAGRSSSINITNALTGEGISFATIGGTDLDWSPDGTKLVSVSTYENNVYTADMVNNLPLLTLSGHTTSVNTVDWSPQGNKLASGSGDDTVRIWDATTGQLLRTITAFRIANVNWSPDGQKLATASYAGTVQIWNVDTGQQLDSYTSPNRIYSVDWNPNGTKIVYYDFATNAIEINTVSGATPTPTPIVICPANLNPGEPTPTPNPNAWNGPGFRNQSWQSGTSESPDWTLPGDKRYEWIDSTLDEIFDNKGW